jgi:L-alanine-DL-glutamate epimerase-like enolase superfamily enzyme
MKITDVEAIILKQERIELIGDGSQDTALILVHTDEGITGIGEVDSSPYVVKEIIDMPASHMACMGLKEILIGEDALDIERLWRKMYAKSIYHGRRSAVIHAMSGIDMALWDAAGKKFGQPISKLLGGSYRDEIRAYCSVLMPGAEDEIKALVEKHIPKGYCGLKMGWGALGQNFKKDIQLAQWSREALGNERLLMLDIGMLWRDVKGAINTAREMAQLDVFWVEEPFGPDELDAYRTLREHSSIHIAGGEEVGGMHEFMDLINGGCVDIVQPDLSRCGGFTIARKLADYAGYHMISIVPHAFKTNILMAATLQYIASLPEAQFIEFCEQDTELRQALTNSIFKADANGMVQIPNRPGLGIELDTEAVQYYRIDK